MLKNTGVVRKIDELGRIVIPKEIRDILNIKSDDNLEFYIENYSIILKKYDKTDSLLNYFNKLHLFFDEESDIKLYITNKDKIITEGNLKNTKLNKKLLDILNERKKYMSTSLEEINSLNGYFNILPIIINSDILGLLIFYKKSVFTKSEENFCNIILKLIENN